MERIQLTLMALLISAVTVSATAEDARLIDAAEGLPEVYLPMGETAEHWIVHSFTEIDYLETYAANPGDIYGASSIDGAAKREMLFDQDRAEKRGFGFEIRRQGAGLLPLGGYGFIRIGGAQEDIGIGHPAIMREVAAGWKGAFPARPCRSPRTTPQFPLYPPGRSSGLLGSRER